MDKKRRVICPYCNEQAEFITTKAFYGKDYGHNLYICRTCDARVGTHKRSKIPKGTLANEELRLLRINCHNLIDPYWKKGKYTRKEVYERLSSAMNIPFKNTHIAQFNIEQCRTLIELLNKKDSIL